MVSDAWVEWAAQNLAAGVAEGQLTEELTRNGIEEGEARALLVSIRQSPVGAAAIRLGAELRKWMSLADALLALESEAHDFSRIPRVRELSGERFLLDYYAANRPVIIEDVASTWPALAKWDLEFLSAGYGMEEVTYQRGRASGDHRDAFVDHSFTSSLGEYIDLIKEGGASNDYYLIAHDRLLDRQAFRPLLEDIVFDPRYLAPADAPGKVFFWLGPAGTITPLHRDLGNVYLAQIRGRKAVKLVPSMQMHKVYNEAGYHSEVDLEDYSAEEYPLLSEAHVMEDVIHPGELLFIPLGWWHQVKALDLSVTITGNNFRFNNAFAAIF